MWICFNDGFVSAVDDIYALDGLVVRARRKEILEKLFPDEKIVVGGSTDYNYRVFVDKERFASVVASRIKEIQYPNFKASVLNKALYGLYTKFWSLHRKYQR